jgi:hypothetical protein
MQETACLDNTIAEATCRNNEEMVLVAGGYSQRRGGAEEKGRRDIPLGVKGKVPNRQTGCRTVGEMDQEVWDGSGAGREEVRRIRFCYAEHTA